MMSAQNLNHSAGEDLSNLELLDNIRQQPRALRQTLAYQLGPGRDDLLAAAGLIRRAGQVVFSSIGASFYASLPSVYALASAGWGVHLENAAELLHYLHPAHGDACVYFLTSRSGESVEIITLLERLKGRSGAVIGLTNMPGSRLARQADLSLYLNCPADQLVAVQSYTATVLTLALLSEAIAGRDPEGLRPELERSIEALEAVLPAWEQASLGWRSFFEGCAPLYLLGRGPALASAQEGALLLAEVAQTPAIGMEAGMFRHGPWEVVDPTFHAVVLAPAGATARLQADLWRSIIQLGGQAVGIGPQAPTRMPPGSHWWTTPALPEYLAPLLEVVPLQLAAYRCAMWRGLRPASFRASGLVTHSETGITLPGLSAPGPAISS